MFNAIKSAAPTRRFFSTVSVVKTQKSLLALSAVGTAVVVMSPAEEFDDLDCQNHVNCHEDPNHPCHLDNCTK